MPQEWTFEVLGDPVPQPRHKVSARFGFARAYIAARHPIHAYRQSVALMAAAAGPGCDGQAYEVEIEAVFDRPPSHRTKSGLRSGAPRFPPKCDWDNLAKGVCDAITESKAFWHNDDQVVDGRCRKRYASTGELAKTRVTVRRTDAPPS